MLLIFAVRAIILEFNSQIFLILINPHIGSVDFIVSYFFFRIFFIIHGDDILGQNFLDLLNLHIIVISAHRFF